MVVFPTPPDTNRFEEKDGNYRLEKKKHSDLGEKKKARYGRLNKQKHAYPCLSAKQGAVKCLLLRLPGEKALWREDNCIRAHTL